MDSFSGENYFPDSYDTFGAETRAQFGSGLLVERSVKLTIGSLVELGASTEEIALLPSDNVVELHQVTQVVDRLLSAYESAEQHSVLQLLRAAVFHEPTRTVTSTLAALCDSRTREAVTALVTEPYWQQDVLQ